MPNNLIFEIDIDGYIKSPMRDPIRIECGSLVTFNYVEDNHSCTYYTKQGGGSGWCAICEFMHCDYGCPRHPDGRYLCVDSDVVFARTSDMMEDL